MMVKMMGRSFPSDTCPIILPSFEYPTLNYPERNGDETRGTCECTGSKSGDECSVYVISLMSTAVAVFHGGDNSGNYVSHHANHFCCGMSNRASWYKYKVSQ
jgi:hypothetical protein